MTIKKGHFFLAQSSLKSFCGSQKREFDHKQEELYGNTYQQVLQFPKEVGEVLRKWDNC